MTEEEGPRCRFCAKLIGEGYEHETHRGAKLYLCIDCYSLIEEVARESLGLLFEDLNRQWNKGQLKLSALKPWSYEENTESQKEMTDPKVEIGFSEDEYKLLEVAAKAEGQTVQEFLYEAAMSWLASSLNEMSGDLEQNAHMLSYLKEKTQVSAIEHLR